MLAFLIGYLRIRDRRAAGSVTVPVMEAVSCATPLRSKTTMTPEVRFAAALNDVSWSTPSPHGKLRQVSPETQLAPRFPARFRLSKTVY
jgi:hypothetical protein